MGPARRWRTRVRICASAAGSPRGVRMEPGEPITASTRSSCTGLAPFQLHEEPQPHTGRAGELVLPEAQGLPRTVDGLTEFVRRDHPFSRTGKFLGSRLRLS